MTKVKVRIDSLEGDRHFVHATCALIDLLEIKEFRFNESKNSIVFYIESNLAPKIAQFVKSTTWVYHNLGSTSNPYKGL